MKYIFFSFFLATLAFAQDNFERLSRITELQRISFGSCNNQNDDQPLWEDLILQKPDLWIWGGDNIYSDWKSEDELKRAYEKQNAHPDYQRFIAQTPIIGTWDDHDYGFNNATGSYSLKKLSQTLALNFLQEPAESSRREQEGIYTSYVFGPTERMVKIILLDNRYFKGLESGYSMLGKKQWDWLEHELSTSKAKINFIVTGLTVLSPAIPYSEEWAETGEMNRMLNLLSKTKPKGVVFLTGDKHFSSRYHRYGHLEFLSSGMTHVAPQRSWWYLRQKFPVTYFGLSYGQIDIDWEGEIPLLTMTMRSVSHKDVNPALYKWMNGQWKWQPRDSAVPTLSRP